ncbi:NAD-dependent epimerase/dehydratase family protein [Candidatus Zixiibacteriota bacterium]
MNKESVEGAGRTAFVTGGNGLVGSWLVRTLLERGYTVRALVRATSDLSFLDDLEVEYVVGDISEPDSYREEIAGSNIVFHVAGVTSVGSKEEYWRVNVDGTRSLADICSQIPSLERFVFISSVAATGPSRDGQPQNEEDPTVPVTPYGESKLAGEAACREGLGGRCALTIVRPGAVYGPWDRNFLRVFQLVKMGILPNRMGDQCVSLIHVEDLADLIERAGRFEIAADRTYMASDPTYCWSSDMGRMIASALDSRVRIFPVPNTLLWMVVAVNWFLRKLGTGSASLTRTRIRDFHERYWMFDSTRAQQELEWSPSRTQQEGLSDTADWYRRMGWL